MWISIYPLSFNLVNEEGFFFSLFLFIDSRDTPAPFLLSVHPSFPLPLPAPWRQVSQPSDWFPAMTQRLHGRRGSIIRAGAGTELLSRMEIALYFIFFFLSWERPLLNAAWNNFFISRVVFFLQFSLRSIIFPFPWDLFTTKDQMTRQSVFL